ncbi:MAG: CsgG/HfaB family protein [Selenomonas sp.]|uniref:CsgG/HfaB family protein n=1 Tax=Selenomonas sp. TaxID=2053611 RepID=UPI0025D52AA4|nr:CsgG/HfaB family protein [Selenomonas sp.]MCR5438396.1 CsgG/HfaB family protein [Selenomonas sp.]
MMKLKGIMAALCLAVTLVMGSSLASAASVSILDHPTLAVLPFANKGIISKEWDREEMNQIHDFAIAELLNTGSFDVVERARLKDVTDEMALAMSGMTNPETAAQVGNLTGAQYLVLGSINSVTTQKSSTSVVGAGTDRYKVFATVSLRVVDVETGRIVLAAVGRGKEHNTVAKLPLNIIRIGTADVDKGQVETALEEAVHDAVSGKQGLLARMNGKVKPAKRR